MRSKRIKTFISFLILFVIGLSVGYAFLTQSLGLKGDISVSENRLIVYFDNIVEEDDNINTIDPAEIIDEKHQIIDMNLNFDNESQKYEFYVDTVNDGTLDLWIESVELQGVDDTDLSKYLDYEVTYTNKDGYEKKLRRCDTLYSLLTYKNSGYDSTYLNKRNIHVVIKIKDDINLKQVKLSNDVKFVINYTTEELTMCDNSYDLIINPAGGLYYDDYGNRSRGNTIISGAEGSEYNFGKAERKGYENTSWISDEGNIYLVDAEGVNFEGGINKWIQPAKDVVLTAVWENRDFVARIEKDRFETIEEAFEAANSGKYTDNTIYVL